VDELDVLPNKMRVFLTLLALLLIGCQSAADRQHREALARLGTIHQATLVTEVASILALPEEKRAFELPPTLWTPEIAKLSPVTVRCYDDGVAILIEKQGSKESGLYVAPGGRVRSASEATMGVRRKVTTEIDWYAL
jgi:hypothetical protein